MVKKRNKVKIVKEIDAIFVKYDLSLRDQAELLSQLHCNIIIKFALIVLEVAHGLQKNK